MSTNQSSPFKIGFYALKSPPIWNAIGLLCAFKSPSNNACQVKSNTDFFKVKKKMKKNSLKKCVSFSRACWHKRHQAWRLLSLQHRFRSAWRRKLQPKSFRSPTSQIYNEQNYPHLRSNVIHSSPLSPNLPPEEAHTLFARHGPQNALRSFSGLRAILTGY